jgi:hypothetical protein
MTRNGKTARLPRLIRDELNRRLRDGEPGKDLLIWLNGLPAVQQVLEKEFGARAINEQNLSEWKQGGYEDWVRRQEALASVRELASQAADIREETGDFSVAELLSAPAAIALSRCLQSIAAKAADDPKEVRALLDILRELGRLRRDDYSQTCLGFQRERWEKDVKFKLLTLKSNGGNHPLNFSDLLRQTLVEMRGDAIKKRFAERKNRGLVSAEEEAHYKQALEKIDRWQKDDREARAHEHVLLAGAGSSDPEPFNNQTESNPIKPDQAA